MQPVRSMETQAKIVSESADCTNISRRILIADDDVTICRMISRALTKKGYRTLLAQNGREAVGIVRSERIDAAILDIQMPVMDGIETLKQIKAISPATEVLLVTGHGDIGSLRQTILRNGAFDYIIKPFHMTDVLTTLENALRKQSDALEGTACAADSAERMAALQKEVGERTRQLRESQIHYKEIIENATDCICIIEDGAIRFMNQRTTSVTGHTEKTLKSIAFADLFRPGDRESVTHLIDIQLHGGAPQATRLFRLQRSDGRMLWMEMTSKRTLWDQNPCILVFMRDVSERVHAETEQKALMASLRRAFHGTIKAMSRAVEQRDPYTAGHQKRVSIIGRRIAEKMKLKEEMAESIRFAGVIHDIGKIAVPSEILSKPGRLTDLEFALIQTHVAVGFDILKEVDFPWPIARIVHEHHERLNGTGYPNGLRGDEICLEARILSVSDVLEAMASHRPYRPALGMEIALNELKSGDASHFDPDVVRATLSLFSDPASYKKLLG